VLTHYLVPDSRFGLDPGLVPHVPRDRPITLVDVGAHQGDFADVIRRHCGLAAAVLVEPQPALAAALSRRFPSAGVQVANVAVSDVIGTQPFEILEADTCSSLLTVRPEAGFQDRNIDVRVRERLNVPVTTLDTIVGQHLPYGTIDLLKVDTQGNELKVIEGGLGSLERTQLLWIEVSFRSLYEGDAPFGRVYARLLELGFRLYSLHDVFRGADRELLQADALFLGPQSK
jgi:FkbM family methyltransferase